MSRQISRGDAKGGRAGSRSRTAPLRGTARVTRLRGAVLGLLLVATGPGCGLGWEPELRQSAIINGVTDPGHPAVGESVFPDGSACSATLVGKRTVLTASHCVTDQQQAPYKTIPGITFRLAGVSYAVASIVMHPQYDFSKLGTTADLAVIRLKQAVTSVMPVPIARIPPALGDTITLVGFGITSTSDKYTQKTSGTKRKGNAVITELPGACLSYTGAASSVCFGDSGGPSFLTRDGRELVVGVHSTLVSNWCEDGGTAARPDASLDWLVRQAEGDILTEEVGPPQVRILAPENDATVTPPLQVSVAAQDALGIRSVELLVDGQPLEQRSNGPFTFEVTSLGAGAHTITARVANVDGLEQAAVVSVVVPDQPPEQPQPEPDPGPEAALEPRMGSIVGGCSAVGATAARATPMSLLSLALLAARRRRRRRKHLAT